MLLYFLEAAGYIMAQKIPSSFLNGIDKLVKVYRLDNGRRFHARPARLATMSLSSREEVSTNHRNHPELLIRFDLAASTSNPSDSG